MKHLFLDFDGVISPYSSILHGIIPCVSESGCDISYFPDIVEWINDKINSPNWKVYWLTTWCPDIEELDPVGIDKKIEIIGNTTDLITEEGYIWKKEVGIEKYHQIINDNPNDLIVWIDDEEDICTHPELDRLYSLSPDSYFGLTNEEMRKIDSL